MTRDLDELYTTLADLKAYMGKALDTSDDLLLELIRAATEQIDQYCNRRFARNADETRTFDPETNVLTDDKAVLYLGNDLCVLTQVINGDGADVTSLVIPEPRNTTPYLQLRLKQASDTEWTYTAADGPEEAISVTGRWSYSITAPEDVTLACQRLAQYAYWQRQAPVFETTAIPELGVRQVPPGIPADVRAMLKYYRRTRVVFG